MKTQLFPYTFVTLRYVHDIMSGEFANVGVVMHAPEARFLGAKCTRKYRRLSDFFRGINGEHFRAYADSIESQLSALGAQFESELPLSKPAKDALDFAWRVLPEDSSAFQWSELGSGITDDPRRTLGDLFLRLVERFQGAPAARRTDDDVWSTFKAEFQKRDILHRVHEKTIEAPNYQYTFDYAWKNGVWNVYQPLTFDLEPTSILEKASHWVGRLVSLGQSRDKFKVYFLIDHPQRRALSSAYEKATGLLSSSEAPGNPILIDENEASKFAEAVSKELKLQNRPGSA